MKKVPVFYTLAVLLFSFLFWGCGSAGNGERADQKEESVQSEDAPAVFGEDFSFAGTWVGEFQGEEVKLTLNEDGSAQMAFSSLDETLNLLGWDVEMLGSENRRNLIIHHHRPIRLNFWYQSPDHLRTSSGLMLDGSRPAQADGWMDWRRK